MNLTATHINYLEVCKCKLWLFSNGINMEHTSDAVYDGKLLHETSYPQRAERYEEMLISVEYEGIMLIRQIDYFDARNKVVNAGNTICCHPPIPCTGSQPSARQKT